MRIVINRIENKKSYLDELSDILACYEKLLKKPHVRIWGVRKKFAFMFGAILLLVLRLGITALLAPSPKSIAYLGLSVVIGTVFVTKVRKVSKLLMKAADIRPYHVLNVNEEKIELTDMTDGGSVVLPCGSIVQVLFARKCIVFMAEKESGSAPLFIAVPIEYKNSVVAALAEAGMAQKAVYSK